MFAPDPKTLSLMIALGNLLFALLATLYIGKTRNRHPALETWRWGRLLAGSGALVNIASVAAPGWVPPVLGNILQLMAGGLDIAAYCLLLDRPGWQRPVKALVGVGVVILLATTLLGEGQGPRLLAFSVLGIGVYGVLATLVLRASRQDWLLKVIGLIDLTMALILVFRVARGLFFSPLVRFDNDLITITLYIVLYLVVVINGFGFLLLAKQKDDRALYRALDELAEIEQDRHRFLAQASHEFRTPAALIKASLDSLRFLQDKLPPEAVSRLENIRLAAQRMTDLSNTLLTHDRLNNQSLLFKPELLDLGQALRGALKLYPSEARIVAELPAEPRPVWADPTQLRIAVQNLIDNAIEHNPPDSGPVRVFSRSTDNFVEICVADSGRGIADSDKAHVFSPFHSRHGSFTRGVGLSIVRQIARKHGGRTRAEDNSPRGTIMVLSLPKVD